ncbi:hypothetical protein [Noviherbaspirillum pedocola]|uniref:Uncharacterized protein n=1 Tax=Noviherbaspirillum pedocola TaxID=2801341 RepID=A0A934SS66_9BURK|nr:hypothetical protein [Noviherbaspirillum pedocola]MBK4734283.1 hypothetical protein [Noviherbaspirillum pedocola]
MLEAAPATTKRGALTYVGAFIVLFGIIMIPFFLCSPLPLVDYPNHVARMYIIANLSHSADLAKYYALNWGFVPNLAMDLIVPALIGPLSAETASWLFTLVTLLLIATGTMALHRALFRRWTYTPFLCFLLLYNRSFIWGFLNYLFTVGLALWVFAAHVHFRKRGSVINRVGLFTIASIVLMTSHLHAFACYAILVGCYEISIAWRVRRKTGAIPWMDLVIPALQFVAPLLIFVLLSSTANRAGEMAYFGILGKINGLVDIFNNYNAVLDVATFAVLGGLFALGLYTRRIVVHQDMRFGIVALFLIYWAMPDQIFSSFFADRRLMVLVGLVLVASMDLRLEGLRWQRPLLAAICLLFVGRMGVIMLNWHRTEPVFRDVLSVMDDIKPGTRVLAMVGGGITPTIQNPPLDHISNLAVVKKNVYINSLFAEPGQQPLRVVTGNSASYSISPSQTLRQKPEQKLANPFPNILWERFDYVLLINPVSITKDIPSYLHPVRHAGVATLYAVGDEAKVD